MGGHDRSVTYAELRWQATAIAAALAAEPQTVALDGELSALVPAALFGSAWAGVPSRAPELPLTTGQPRGAGQAARSRHRRRGGMARAAAGPWPDLPGRPRTAGGLDLHERHDRGAESCGAAARPADRVHSQHGRVRRCGRRRSRPRRGPAVPHRRGGNGALIDVRRAADGAAPPLRSRGMAPARPGRAGHPRFPCPDDACPHNCRDGSRPRAARAVVASPCVRRRTHANAGDRAGPRTVPRHRVRERLRLDRDQ